MKREFFKFLKDAYTGGLCSEYRDEIRSCREDKLQLVRLAMRQQSIPYMATMMRNGSLTKKFALSEFGNYLNGFILRDCDGVPDYTYSWYMDYSYDNDIEVDVDVCHISHTEGATVIIPKTKCPRLYISNGSSVNLVCDGFNSIKIYLFDDSSVTVEDTDVDSEVVVYKYSDECEVTEGGFSFGKVKSFKKELRL